MRFSLATLMSALLLAAVAVVIRFKLELWRDPPVALAFLTVIAVTLLFARLVALRHAPDRCDWWRCIIMTLLIVALPSALLIVILTRWQALGPLPPLLFVSSWWVCVAAAYHRLYGVSGGRAVLFGYVTCAASGSMLLFLFLALEQWSGRG